MPRVARFKVAAIHELLQQLRYAPEKTRKRQMDAAERLVSEIDPSRVYPEDFIVFRITGYRPEHGSSAMLVGEALLGDLVNFVLHISRDLHLPAQHAGRTALRLDDIARDLNISSKTLQRYRAKGLVCHYVYFDNRQLLGCFDDSLRRFVDSNSPQVKRAAGFTRIGDYGRQQIIDEARMLRESENLSLNEAALRIAERHGRAHETVRVMLRKHDLRSERPIFFDTEPISDRDARLLYRAWRLGIPVADMAARFNKTATTIHRAINRRRGSLLQSLDLAFVPLPTFTLQDASTVILSHPAVTSGLDDLLPADDALELITAARSADALDDDTEQAMIAGYNFLKRRAAATIAAFGPWPGALELDQAETDLRWAHRLKCRLVSSAMPAALRSIEQHLHRSLEDQPAEVIMTHLNLAMEVVAIVVDTIDPSRGQRLLRLAAQAVDRALAASTSPRQSGRAAMRHRQGTLGMVAPYATMTPWAWLDESRIDVQHLDLLGRDLRLLITKRHGLGGTPPRTCEAIAVQLGRSAGSVARRLATAERQMRELAR